MAQNASSSTRGARTFLFYWLISLFFGKFPSSLREDEAWFANSQPHNRSLGKVSPERAEPPLSSEFSSGKSPPIQDYRGSLSLAIDQLCHLKERGNTLCCEYSQKEANTLEELHSAIKLGCIYLFLWGHK